MKQNKNQKQTLESAQYGLEISFKIKINLSYFPSRARLNFQWIFKEFYLKSNMKGFFETFLALICRCMRCLAISNFYFLALSVKKLKKVSITSYFTIKFLVDILSCTVVVADDTSFSYH